MTVEKHLAPYVRSLGALGKQGLAEFRLFALLGQYLFIHETVFADWKIPNTLYLILMINNRIIH